MKHIYLSLLLSITFSFPLFAREKPDKNQIANHYLAYPVPEYGIPDLSPSPDGYVPFHMEHYGRHGSRWRINPDEYSKPLKFLKKAHDRKKLTPRGEQLYNEIKQIAADSKGRLGELTPLGHRQHRGIASRMAKNFPQLFSDSTYLDAKSTEVIRCILSMANEVAELQALYPGMPVKMDASQTTQDILNPNPTDPIVFKLADAAKPAAKAFRKSLPKPDAFFNKIFNDRKFVKENLGEEEVFKAIFDLAINVQSHDSYPYFNDIFTYDELYNEWLARNAEWYVRFGNTPLTKNRTPFNQRVLLKNIIESADTAILTPNVSVNLRFGHDTMLTPLSVLMELDELGYETTDLKTVADHWRTNEISPMGANIQMIFYRPENRQSYSEEDVIVKVLLNEAETKLPVTPVTGNYYRWKDLREYYLRKIANMPKVSSF